jgi:hypothetical protein
MEKSLTTTNGILTLRPEISALNDSPFVFDGGPKWRAGHAKKELQKLGVDVEKALNEIECSLVPVDQNWLQKRLRLLWKSATPAKSLEPTSWLHETARLLMDVPKDILNYSIDEAIKTSEYMPNVGSIRKFADPLIAQRAIYKERLSAIINLPDKRCRKSEKEMAAEEREEISKEFRILINQLENKCRIGGEHHSSGHF